MNNLAAILGSRRRLPMLDGLRAVAITLVMLMHFGVRVSGGLGVNLFFTLSGFLITWLLLAELAQSSTIDFKGFYLRRTFRIFPAYYAFLVVFGTLSYFKGDHWRAGNVWAVATYTMDWYVPFHDKVHVMPLWSLAVEEQFYLLWPLTLWLLVRKGGKWPVAGVLSIIAMGVAWRSVAYSILKLPYNYLYMALDSRLDNLMVGCLLAIVLNQRQVGVERAARLLVRFQWLPIVTIALLLWQSEGFVTYRNTVGYTVEALLCAVLLLQVLQLSSSAWWIWFEHPMMRYVGRISYSLYLYNPLADSVVQRLQVINPIIKIGGSLALSIAIASASFHWVEKPFLVLKDKLGERRLSARARKPQPHVSAI
jgi:peptidoglycan/LPS O-acetylase OafA/YrhL